MLLKTTDEALGGQRITRAEIPADLELFRSNLAAAGMAASQINQFMQITAQRDGVPITWNYKDVWHQFLPSTEDLRLDADALTSWIRM